MYKKDRLRDKASMSYEPRGDSLLSRVQTVVGSEGLSTMASMAFCSGEQQRKMRVPRLLKANLKYMMWPMATKDTEMMTSRPKASGLGARITMMKCSRSRR